MEARAGNTHHRLGSVSPYGYTPSLAPSLAYLVVFSVLTLAHIVMGIRYKYWIVFVTLVPGGLCEYSRSSLSPTQLGLVLIRSGDFRMGSEAMVALPDPQH